MIPKPHNLEFTHIHFLSIPIHPDHRRPHLFFSCDNERKGEWWSHLLCDHMKANSFDPDTIKRETLNNGEATMRYSMTTRLNVETHCVGHHSGTDTYSVNREAERIRKRVEEKRKEESQRQSGSPFVVIPALTCLSSHLRLWNPDTLLPPSLHLNHYTKMDR